MKVAVVGHVEWVEFLRVDHVPRAGEILHTTGSVSVPAGGGAVAAVQLARMGAESVLFTSFGDDELGARAATDLRRRGVTVHAVTRAGVPQRRGITLVDARGERTILIVGTRHVAHGDDALPWSELASCAAVYITGGDAAALRAARACPVVVSTARIVPLLRESGIAVDALAGSDDDPSEVYAPGMLAIEPRLVVRTDGARGGRYLIDGVETRYAAVPTLVTGDTYGAGDTFAAALACALGERRAPADACAFAAARAAEVLAFAGPYP